jgi:putative ubiquitin-RnfH superfamily antitoxin RatB of RatAB toxin-antitoxin module
MVDAVSGPGPIQVEVAYALPDKQVILALEVAAGTTALEAAQQSGVTGKFAGIDLDNAKMGIFGKVVAPQQVLQEGDRVEIYRPLIADPKEVRKARAARAKERRAADKEG